MPQFVGQTGTKEDGKPRFGVMSAPQVQEMLKNKLSKDEQLSVGSQLGTCINHVMGREGKASGTYRYQGEPVLHVSSGKKGTKKTCTLFYVEREDVAKVVGIGKHLNGNTYEILWAESGWKSGKTVQLN